MEVHKEKNSRNRGMGGNTSGKRARPGVMSDLPLANRQQNRVIQRSRYEPLNNIQENTEEITFEETTLGGFPIILGLPWLKKHNPEIGWKTHEIRFNSEYCQNNCMNVGTTVEDITDEEAFIQKQLRPEDISLISATAFKRAARLGIAGSVSMREIDEDVKLYASNKYQYMRKDQPETKKISVEEIVPTE